MTFSRNNKIIPSKMRIFRKSKWNMFNILRLRLLKVNRTFNSTGKSWTTINCFYSMITFRNTRNWSKNLMLGWLKGTKSSKNSTWFDFPNFKRLKFITISPTTTSSATRKPCITRWQPTIRKWEWILFNSYPKLTTSKTDYKTNNTQSFWRVSTTKRNESENKNERILNQNNGQGTFGLSNQGSSQTEGTVSLYVWPCNR